jgi:uncharacterized protein YjbI with pentapeptide repeats
MAWLDKALLREADFTGADLNRAYLPLGRPHRSELAQGGSLQRVNTIGTVRVASCNASTAGAPAVTRMSGVSATSSAAKVR